ncbi:receptor cytoplasmic kinase [Trifolium repens]|nr:receptor cytoplasmic kinase [Trifolium repens]
MACCFSSKVKAECPTHNRLNEEDGLSGFSKKGCCSSMTDSEIFQSNNLKRFTFNETLNQENNQGQREWLTKINNLGQLHHPNLVKKNLV